MVSWWSSRQTSFSEHLPVEFFEGPLSPIKIFINIYIKLHVQTLISFYTAIVGTNHRFNWKSNVFQYFSIASSFSHEVQTLTLKRLGGQFDRLWFFHKCLFRRETKALLYDFWYCHKSQFSWKVHWTSSSCSTSPASLSFKYISILFFTKLLHFW